MSNWTLTSGLIVAGVLVASGSAVAQEQPYPDLKGTWTGQTHSLRQGNADHFPDTGETGPVFVEAPGASSSTGRRGTGSRARGGERRARGATRSWA